MATAEALSSVDKRLRCSHGSVTHAGVNVATKRLHYNLKCSKLLIHPDPGMRTDLLADRPQCNFATSAEPYRIGVVRRSSTVQNVPRAAVTTRT
jgi:hypothetical protein